MSKDTLIQQGSSFSALARQARHARHLTQRELADITGVSRREVRMFEHSLPVNLDIRRRLLKELWAAKTGKG